MTTHSSSARFQEPPNDDFPTLYDLLALARRHLLALGSGAAIGVLLGAGAAYLLAPGFTTELAVSANVPRADGNPDNANNLLSRALAKGGLATVLAAEVDKALASSGPGAADARAELARALGVSTTEAPDRLAEHLRSVTAGAVHSARSPRTKFAVRIAFATTDLITVAVTMPKPGHAAPIATAFANTLPASVASYNKSQTDARWARNGQGDPVKLDAMIRQNKAFQGFLAALRQFGDDLSKAAPHATAEPTNTVIPNHGSARPADFGAVEVFRMQMRLAKAASTLPPQAYAGFNDRLASLAANFANSAGEMTETSAPGDNPTRGPTDPRTYALPSFGDRDSVTTTTVTHDARSLKLILFSMIGAIAGLSVAIFGSVFASIVANARSGISASKFA